MSIIYDSSSGAVAYSEIHSATTDASGLINIAVGNGTSSDSYAAIDWSRSSVYLKSEIDLGSGYVDVGTDLIGKVPMALYAKTLEGLTITSGTISATGANLSLKENINGNQNTAIGMGSLNSATEGDANTALGLSSGSDLTGNSNYNTFIGALSGVNSSNINGSSALGFNAKVGTSYTIRLGDEYVTKWSFGLPTTDTGNAIQVGDDTTNGNGASLTSAGVWTNASSILFKTNFI